TCSPPGYRWRPSASTGPSYAFLATSTWAGVRQVGWSTPTGHWIEAGSKWHVRGSSIWPSTRPSAPSQEAMAAPCSAGSLAGVRMEFPCASELMAASQVWNSPLSGAQTLAGAPATMPSKSVGNRWASCSASRPPSERSEEHTSELQSPDHLVCRLLLEKKNKKK